jgi:hypothetical protein
VDLYKYYKVNNMQGKTFGIPNSILTILAVDAVIIGLYATGTLNTHSKLIGAKVIGTSALVGASMIA